MESFLTKHKTKSYNKLIQAYDKSTNPDEKKAIHKLVDELEDIELEDNFVAYPSYHSTDFVKDIYSKKEFHINKLFLDTTGIEDKCANTDFTIEGHQNFLKNFITKESPYMSLLIYHGVGVGKTCTALTIAENFRDVYARKDRRIIILSSKNIQIGWKNTIYTPSKKSNQCTGKTFVDKAETDRQVNALVKQYYELMAYQSFANYVERMLHAGTRHLPDDKKEEGKINIIKEYFSNRVLIIDEVHNIRDDQSNIRKTIQMIKYVITHSDNMRLLLLSATPMYNRSSEILWILNMMLLNDKRPLLDKKEILDSEGNITGQGKVIIQSKCRSYISYLRGENPMTFPIRIYPSKLRARVSSQKVEFLFKKYKNNSRDKLLILNNKNSPKNNLVGQPIKEDEKLKFMELFGSRMTNHQLKTYLTSIELIIQQTPSIDLSNRGEINPILDNLMLKQISNIAYPSKSDLEPDNIADFYGEKSFKDLFHMRTKGQTREFEYKKRMLDEFGPIFDKGELHKYSTKISSIVESIENSEGVVFIYSEYIYSGVIPLMLALEQNGYRKFSGEKVLKYPEWKKGSTGNETKREPMSYDGRTKSQAGTSFKQAKYMVIDGSMNKFKLKDELKVVNSSSNSSGERIKVIIGSVVASEGLDFKGIRSIHILDPWVHLNRLEQIIGRGIRYCSHSFMEQVKRNVTVYIHSTILPKEQESIDTSIYRYAEKKAVQIGEIETILKQNAIDRYLFREVNVIGENDINTYELKPAVYISKQFDIVPHDQEYSKTCSFMKKCDFNADLKHDPYYKEVKDIKLDHLNDDTFIEDYSVNNVNNILKKITLLYKEKHVYDIHSIVGILNEYGYNHDNIIYQAMEEMLSNRYTVVDSQGQIGYIINKGKYYIFQPFLLNDPEIPLYYRMNDSSHVNEYVKLDKYTKDIKEFNCLSEYFDTDVSDVYENISSSSNELLDVVTEKLRSVIAELDDLHPVYIGYILSRISFEDKCKLIYGLLRDDYTFDNPWTPIIDKILMHNIIYEKDDNYYLYESINKKDIKQYKPFGFYICYDSKPVYWEFNNNKITKCNRLQLMKMDTMVNSYKETKIYDALYNETPAMWCYIINKDKGGKEDTFMKVVNNKLKQSTTFPPGPGNICLDNSQGFKNNDVKKLIHDEFLPIYEVFKLNDKNDVYDKKHLCCLLEVLFRYSRYTTDINTFYTYDTIWLKY